MTRPTDATLVAVYGTLRQGFENYEAFLAGFEPVHRGFIHVPFRMYATDAYPMLVHGDRDRPIYVEIFSVDPSTLARLDGLEDPYGYGRTAVRVAEVSGSVDVYVYRGSGPPEGFRFLDSGRWEPPPTRSFATPPC